MERGRRWRLFAADPELEWVPVAWLGQPPAGGGRPPAGAERGAAAGRLRGRCGPTRPFPRPSGARSRGPRSERLVPLIRCDSRERYVAVVRVERIIAELADAYEAQPLPSPQS